MVTHRETVYSPGDISKPNPSIRIDEATLMSVKGGCIEAQEVQVPESHSPEGKEEERPTQSEDG